MRERIISTQLLSRFFRLLSLIRPSVVGEQRGIITLASPGEMGPDVSAQPIADSLRTSTPPGAPTQNLRASLPASQDSSVTDRLELLNLEDSVMYLKFSTDAMYFAILPNFPRPPSATPCNRSSKRGDCFRVPRQIRGNLADPSWANATGAAMAAGAKGT